jgi:hypothetical protein
MSPALVERVLKVREEVGREKFTEQNLKEAVGADIYQGLQEYITLGGSSGTAYFTIVSEAELEDGFILKIKSLQNINPEGNKPVKIIQWTDWVT